MKTNPIVDLLKGFFPNLRYFWVSTALSLSLLIPGGKLNPRHVTARGTCHTIIYQDLLGFDVKTDENNKYRAPTSARESHSGKPETGGEWTPGERKTSASGIRNQKEREISNLYPSPVIKKAVRGTYEGKSSEKMTPSDLRYGSKCLTVSGRTALQCFPDDVVQKAFAALQKKKDVRSPLGYVVAFCSSHCKENGIAIDYEKRNRLRQEIIALGVTNAAEWRDLSPEELATIAEEKKKGSPQREWQGFNKKCETLTEVIIAPENVEENVKILEADGLFSRITGIDPRSFFADALVNGEKVERTVEEKERMRKGIEKHEREMRAFQERRNNSRVNQEKKREFLSVGGILRSEVEKLASKFNPGSTEKKEVGDSNGNISPGSIGFASIERREVHVGVLQDQGAVPNFQTGRTPNATPDSESVRQISFIRPAEKSEGDTRLDDTSSVRSNARLDNLSAGGSPSVDGNNIRLSNTQDEPSEEDFSIRNLPFQ